MDYRMVIILILFCLSIFLGVKLRINIGLITMVVALLYGSIALDMELSTILGNISIKLLFNIISVTLFYGIAQQNGTLNNLAVHVMYSIRKSQHLIPAVIFFLTATIAYMGVGIFAGAILAPIAFEIGMKSHYNPLLIYCCVNCGAILGSNMPKSLGGIIIQELISLSPYQDKAMQYTVWGTILTLIVCIMMVAIAHGIYRRTKAACITFTKPEPFSKAQRANLVLIGMVSLVMFVGPALRKSLTGIWVQRLSVLTDVGVICTFGALIAILFRIGNERETIHKYVPWNTIISLTGISALLGVISEVVGFSTLPIQLFSALPPIVVAPLVASVAGMMSFFTSGLTVVCPTLFPLVPFLASATGTHPGLLYAVIFTGASVTGTSPFSAAGSMVLSSYGTITEQNELFYKILPIPLLLLVMTILLTIFFQIFM